MRKIIVDSKNNNKLLSSFLLNSFDGLSSSIFYKTLRKKDIKVNGKRVTQNINVFKGDEVLVYLTDEYLFNNTTTSYLSLDIVYEDDNILVINKPQGLAVTENRLNENTLDKIVQITYPKCMPCHRLDRNTSGLVVFAKNNDALTILVEKFKNKEINKKYRCDVYGILDKKSDTLKSYLFKDNKKSRVYISDEKKKNYLEIITKYTVISENKKENYSTLEVELITGRTHQIRAHLSHIGHPIIGDGKYGKNDINKKFNEKYQRLCSTEITFGFTTSSGILDYLNNKTIKIKEKITRIK